MVPTERSVHKKRTSRRRQQVVLVASMILNLCNLSSAFWFGWGRGSGPEVRRPWFFKVITNEKYLIYTFLWNCCDNSVLHFLWPGMILRWMQTTAQVSWVGKTTLWNMTARQMSQNQGWKFFGPSFYHLLCGQVRGSGWSRGCGGRQGRGGGLCRDQDGGLQQQGGEDVNQQIGSLPILCGVNIKSNKHCRSQKRHRCKNI